MSVAHCSDNVHSLPTLTPVSLPSVYSRATTMLTKKCARLKRLQRCRSCLPSTARGVNYRPCGMRSVRHYRVVRTRSCSNISKIIHTVDCRSPRSPDHRGILLLLLVHGGRCRGNISRSPIQLTVDHVDHQIATAYCYHMVANVRMLKTPLHEQFHLLLAACVRLLH